uniref:Putative structural protein n=1 Tax=viral metagenome TaxID=1070528 RepID=A0A6M3K0J0_9ZZZZ
MSLFSNTLAVVRQYLSMEVGDLLYGQCGTTGATTTKIYAPFLWQANDYYNNHNYNVYVYAGTNIGVEKRVTDWVLADFLLTVHSVYAAACDATSYVELHHIFTQDEYRKAINLAIESIAGKYLIDIKDEATIRLTSTEDNLENTVYAWEYALPTSMLYLHRVITEEPVSGIKLTGTISDTAFTDGETITGGTSGATGELSYDAATYIRVSKVSGTFVTGETATGGTSSETCSAITAVESETAGGRRWLDKDIIDPRDYSIIKSYPAKLKLDKRYYSIDADLYLRLEGQGTQPIVDSDSDIIYLPPDWVVQKAITFLPQSKIQSNKLDNVFRQALIMSAREPRYAPNPSAKRIME